MNNSNFEQSIYYQNVRGLRTKTSTFFCNMLASNYKIVALTETNLQASINSSELFPNNFNVFRCDRNLEVTGRQGGGGVLLAISNELSCYTVDSFNVNIPGCEYIWVKIPYNKGGALYICVVYFRPKSNLGIYQSFYDAVLQVNFTGNSHLVILGDFNLQIYGNTFLLNSGDNLCKELCTFLNLHNLSLNNDIRNFQNKTLDLVISNVNDVVVTRCEEQLTMEDPYHPAIEARIIVAAPLSYKSRSTGSAGYCYKRADFLQIYRELLNMDWSHLYSILNINEAVDYFYEQIYNILNRTCPLKKKKHSKYPFWFTPSIISKLKLKEKMRRKFKKIGSQDNYNM